MIDTVGTEVARRAADVVQASRDGAGWLERNHERLRLDPVALGYKFRGFARTATRLRLAAERPTAVAVFGASQAGKSYLVSGLAAPRGKPLIAAYGTERLNFLTDLNPEGGKESTGLVSRFTIRQIPSPPDAPVPLRLLSQTDVVKILANTFLEDFQLADLKLPGSQAVTELLQRLEAQAGPAPRDGLTVDDIEEMREYFDFYFRGRELIRDLGTAYWTRAAELIPRLPAEARAAAYAPLWNGNERITAVAAGLIGALSKIGFADVAFCSTEALSRRGGNLLDAATVLKLGQPSAGSVTVATSAGGRATLDRAALTALIAEVTVPLAERPWDFFEHTDLLDFPGARSRKEHEDIDKALAAEQGLGELFLRGKVAYLFQRYNAEQEIAAMVLCVGPSVQEVSTLPKMVTGWIGHTMGDTPALRQAQRTSLFFVLTKFDMELDDKLGADLSSGQRWTNRLTASLLEPFGPYDWPNEWTPGRPFNNLFWLRSTAVPLRNVFKYAEDKSETIDPDPRAAKFLADNFTAYAGNELVRRHFADARLAWDEVLRPNDGGISNLANALRPICDPALKAEQIGGRVAVLANAILTQLRPHHHTGDLLAELERARADSRSLVQALVACAKAQMFGALLRALQVTSDQVTGVYWDLQTSSEVPIGAANVESDYADALGDLLGEPAAATQGTRDRSDMFADMALAEWASGMAAIAEDAATATALRVPREQAMILVRELERAARRQDLRGLIAATLRDRAGFHNRAAAAAQKPVMIVEQAINNFVHVLGFDRLPPDKRPEAPRGTRRIFAPRPAVNGLPKLGPTPAPYGLNFEVDWMTAISQTIEANAQHTGSSTIDIAANEQLGAIITRLEGAAA
jgi:hypothetical protein